MIQGVIYSNQKVSAKDHASLFQMLISDGIISGCGSSSRLNVFTISSGAFIAAGRLTRINGSERIEIPAGHNSQYARVKGVCDLTKAATTEEFKQFEFEVDYANTADGFDPLVRENVNTDGEKYEVEWAVLTIDENGIISNVDVKIGQSHSGSTGGAITEAVFSSYGTSGTDYAFASSGDDWEVAFLTSNSAFHLDRDLENVDVFIISAGDDGGTGSAYIDQNANKAYGGSGGNGGDYLAITGTTIPFGDYNVHIGASGDKVTSFGTLFRTDSQEVPAQHKNGGDRAYTFASRDDSNSYAENGDPGEEGVLAWGDSATVLYPGRIYGSSSGGGGSHSSYTGGGYSPSGTGSPGSSGTNAGASGTSGSDGSPGVANTGSAGGAGGTSYAQNSKTIGTGGLGGSGIILIRNHKETPAA